MKDKYGGNVDDDILLKLNLDFDDKYNLENIFALAF